MPKFSLTFKKKAIFFMELICRIAGKGFTLPLVEEITAELFRTRSFDNIWYWLLLSVSWSLATQWTLGVGHYDARAAVAKGGRHMTDFETLVEIYCNRMHENGEKYGAQAVLIASFLLASLATLGFWFWILFAQALFMLVFPVCLTLLLSIMVANRQVRDPVSGKRLIKRYRKLRMLKQTIGVFAISMTSFWGTIVILRAPLV